MTADEIARLRAAAVSRETYEEPLWNRTATSSPNAANASTTESASTATDAATTRSAPSAEHQWATSDVGDQDEEIRRLRRIRDAAVCWKAHTFDGITCPSPIAAALNLRDVLDREAR